MGNVMKSDIDNWVNFLNETTSKANMSNVTFNEEGVYNDLKLTAIPMLKDFIGEFKGRHLTNLLLNLKKSFQLVSKQLKNDHSLDDFRKLSFLALSNVVTEILREMRVDAYSKGKNFDPIIFLDNYEESLINTNNKEKERIVFSKLKKNKKSKKEEDDDEIEEDSEDEDDSDYIPTYIDEEEDDEEYDEDEDDEDDEDEDDTLSDRIKRNHRKRKNRN